MKKTNQLVNKLKENKGITLIALVITIIVLLILAGVAVSNITGNEGVMDKAQNAKVATDKANEEEEIKMAAVTAMADNMEGLGTLTADKLKTALNNKYPVVDEVDKIKVFAINQYTLDKNGSVTNDGETPKGEFSITSFSYTPNTVSIGGTSSEPTINVSGTPYKGPKYTSSDTAKATVNETTGVVTGVDAGEVTITVTYTTYNGTTETRNTTIEVKSPNPHTINEAHNFSYTGSVQTFTVYPGTYKLEVWGAQGGGETAITSSNGTRGGYGGYSYGNYTVDSSQTLYIYVGGKGTSKSTQNGGMINGGWNGGGPGRCPTGNTTPGASGGGGTDISTVSATVSLTNNIYKRSTWNGRILVAGGGGGMSACKDYSTSWTEYGDRWRFPRKSWL